MKTCSGAVLKAYEPLVHELKVPKFRSNAFPIKHTIFCFAFLIYILEKYSFKIQKFLESYSS